jgi:hypothetical protein
VGRGSVGDPPGIVSRATLTGAIISPMAKLVEEVSGDGPWRYVRPDKRTGLAESHLAGYEPGKGPRFQWEPELLEARRKNNANVDRSKRKAQPAQKPE